MKKPTHEGLSFLNTSSVPATQVDAIIKRLAEMLQPAIDAAVKHAIRDFMADLQPPTVAHHNGHDTQCRPLAELLTLPAGALVTPREASLLTGLPIESMKNKRRFHSFPESVKVGHRSIKWKMGDIRKYLKEQAAP